MPPDETKSIANAETGDVAVFRTQFGEFEVMTVHSTGPKTIHLMAPGSTFDRKRFPKDDVIAVFRPYMLDKLLARQFKVNADRRAFLQRDADVLHRRNHEKTQREARWIDYLLTGRESGEERPVRVSVADAELAAAVRQLVGAAFGTATIVSHAAGRATLLVPHRVVSAIRYAAPSCELVIGEPE